MPNWLIELFTTDAWWGHVVYIVIFYLVAWIVHRLSRFLARRLVKLSRLTSKGREIRPERRETLRSMLASVISFVAFAAATIASVGRFVTFDTLVWVVGLFSAAFGLSARPLISDVLAGIGLIFEDTFAVGEKVEILGIEGIIEAVNLRTTWLRAPTGELYILPNGEIRVVRNFSRGRFSIVKVTLKIAAADINRALMILEELGNEAVVMLPNLLEPWQVLSESGVIGQQTELTLMAKARFGQAAEMRPRLLAVVQERLAEAGIALAG
ncbi:MAG: mechanosensitive ion channel [Anaerolineae bacterium]|nr:mechanosensitive ion channel [Anaerolineae bacterium]